MGKSKKSSSSSSSDNKDLKNTKNANKSKMSISHESLDIPDDMIPAQPQKGPYIPVKNLPNEDQGSDPDMAPPPNPMKISQRHSQLATLTTIKEGLKSRYTRDNTGIQESSMPSNTIQPPCRGKDTGDCSKCNKKPMPLDEFSKKVTYEVVKLGTTVEGIFPLTKGSDTFKCEFLQNWIQQNVKCKFLIVVAMYNEVCTEFEGTLDGIKKNIDHFTSGRKSINIEEIGVVFIIDGIEPFLKSFLKMEGSALSKDRKSCFRKNFSYFSQFFNLDIIKETFGVEDLLKKDRDFDFELMRNLFEADMIERGQEIAHLFSQRVNYSSNYSLNTIFCVKHLNKRKLNTHRWFFEGFCRRIIPDYVALLDVGTIPMPTGLYLLFEAMEDDHRVAGCCGEILPDDTGPFNPVVQAQVVEYKFAHIMDKGLESIIGYVSVLPGAFSAYRWEALDDPTTLNAYFYSQRPGALLDLFKANMYLAEDRILCLELMCQKDRWNILRFVKGSEAVTDVPDNLNTLMAQRRRWVNGSWFSMIYTIKNCNRIDNSNHSWLRKCMFKTLMFYYAIIAVFNWVLVGSFYLAFVISLKMNLGETDNEQDKLTKWSTPLIYLYGCLLCCILLTSFAVKPAKIELLYRLICLILGLYTYTTIFLTLYFIYQEGFIVEKWRSQLAAAMIIFLGLIFTIIILLNFRTSLRPVLKGVASYIFMTGSYVNIFLIYSICNIHDVSWGNRPDKMTIDEKALVDDYKNERTRWVLVWILMNASFAYLSNIVTSSGSPWGKAYIIVLMLVAYVIIIMKFVGGFFYVLDELCCTCLHEDKKKNRS
jgi:chitin synthase